MKVYVQIYGENNIDKSSSELFDMYNKMLSESTECELTDNSPDIVHLFGMPTEKMIADAKRFNSAEVPVAYSPMGAYMLTGKRIKPKLAFIHTFGPKEAEIISRLKMKSELICYPSPILTDSPADSFFAFMKQTYIGAIEKYDKEIRESIDRLVNNTIAHHVESLPDREVAKYEDEKDILFKILYIRHMLRRNALPRPLLIELSQRLETCDIDEPELLTLTKKLHCTKLMRRIIYLLDTNHMTTEGYLPAEPLPDSKLKIDD